MLRQFAITTRPLTASLLALTLAAPVALAQSDTALGEAQEATQQAQTTQTESAGDAESPDQGMAVAEEPSDAGGDAQTVTAQESAESSAGAKEDQPSTDAGATMADQQSDPTAEQPEEAGTMAAEQQSGTTAEQPADVETMAADQQADPAGEQPADTGAMAADHESGTMAEQPADAGAIAADHESGTMAEQPADAGAIAADQQSDRPDAAAAAEAARSGEMMAEPQVAPSDDATPAPQVSDGGMMMTPEQMGETVMLDIEGFAQEIYERGYRQGYIRGITDARVRMSRDFQRMQRRAARTPMEPGSESAPPAKAQRPDDMGHGHGGEHHAEHDMHHGAESDERGTIIVLPPGVSPRAFIEQMMRAQRQGFGE